MLRHIADRIAVRKGLNKKLYNKKNKNLAEAERVFILHSKIMIPHS